MDFLQKTFVAEKEGDDVVLEGDARGFLFSDECNVRITIATKTRLGFDIMMSKNAFNGEILNLSWSDRYEDSRVVNMVYVGDPAAPSSVLIETNFDLGPRLMGLDGALTITLEEGSGKAKDIRIEINGKGWTCKNLRPDQIDP